MGPKKIRSKWNCSLDTGRGRGGGYAGQWERQAKDNNRLLSPNGQLRGPVQSQPYSNVTELSHIGSNESSEIGQIGSVHQACAEEQ